MTTLTELQAIQTSLQQLDDDFEILDRGKMYVRLQTITNSSPSALEGNIATFSGFFGGAAYLANYILGDMSRNEHSQYPLYDITNASGQPNAVYQISQNVALDHINTAINDLSTLTVDVTCSPEIMPLVS